MFDNAIFCTKKPSKVWSGFGSSVARAEKLDLGGPTSPDQHGCCIYDWRVY